ncbi:MAG: cbb3-type cytochrome c oxidase subunit I, partial [Actinobacteria bacterium]|nr:cbb3-type cytochrome c oxidase subunit I [Actinomycetota bacterium]
MTTYAERPTINPVGAQPSSKGKNFVKWITSTDHKTIGYMYLMATFGWFLVGGLLALFLRAELTRPGMQFLSNEQYNQIFTMHGTIMLLMFATPLFVGFANVIMPLQIGAADVAFPRLNMLSFWLFMFGSITAVAGF